MNKFERGLGYIVGCMIASITTIGILVSQLTATTIMPNTAPVPITIISLTNEQRKTVNVSGLVEDPYLDQIAQIRADEMAKTGVFDHTRPDGQKFTELFIVNGKWITPLAGENIGKNVWTSQQVIDCWMASPSHKKNIERPQFTKIGVGVARASNGYYYVAQEFAQ